MKKRRELRRNSLIEKLGGVCSDCGISENLEFDHIDRKLKKFTLSGAGLDKPWILLLQEIEKCQLLCKPCHRKKTIEFGETGGGHNKVIDPEHGTAVMYDRCKCDKCKEWKRLYRAKLVDSKGIPV